MAYAIEIGLRHLRSKKSSSISVITGIAVTAVALGVAALLCVLAITSGFQREFRDKVLGVNAHVLILKYGVDFDEYRDVMARAMRNPEVVGAGPFLIQEAILTHESRTNVVIVKGVDPQGIRDVLDLPSQLVQGSLDGLRAEGAMPQLRPDDIAQQGRGDWEWLEDLAERSDGGTPDAGALDTADGGVPDPLEGLDVARLTEHVAEGRPIFDGDGGIDPALVTADAPARPAPRNRPAPSDLLDPASVEALLNGGGPDVELPSDEWDERFAEDERERSRQNRSGTADLPGAIVGVTLARQLGLGVGSRVSLVSALSGLGLNVGDRAPVARDFRVIGIFQAGFQEYDSDLVYVDIYEAQRYYGQGDAVTGVELRLRHLDLAPDVASELEDELGGPFHTLDWAALNRNLFTALKIQKVVLGLVFTSITIVAAFMVVATLIMVVLEKKREIAILKAMGATDVGILVIFAIQGVIVGIVGTFVGLVLGASVILYLDKLHFALDPKVYLIDHLPVVVSPIEFVITAIVSLIICSVATLAPSLWAARMLPVDGLRYE
jgi:lipoprotein-releasing system permease protein